MKILILASGKCGSSALLSALSEEYEVEPISEPFNYDLQRQVLQKLQEEGRTYYEYADKTPHINLLPHQPRENIVVKCIPGIGQYPTHSELLSRGVNKANMTKFFVDFSKKFDKLIILSADNKAKQLFSILHAHKHNTWGGPYEVKPFDLIPKDLRYFKDFFDIQDILNKISKHFNVEITSYEKLFNEDKEVSRKEFKKVGSKKFDYLYDKYFNPQHKFTTYEYET